MIEHCQVPYKSNGKNCFQTLLFSLFPHLKGKIKQTGYVEYLEQFKILSEFNMGLVPILFRHPSLGRIVFADIFKAIYEPGVYILSEAGLNENGLHKTAIVNNQSKWYYINTALPYVLMSDKSFIEFDIKYIYGIECFIIKGEISNPDLSHLGISAFEDTAL